ncbi:MAG: helix-turn-helix domain-containing protein [Chloroflexi bacterium]|nr:helix-turn-helix domain-containing protein [Chloroflexota bacterium]
MTQQTEATEADLRHQAVKLYRAGIPVDDIAALLGRSRRWVYHWVAYQRAHPHTHFRSASRAPHHHPNQISRQMRYRIVRLRAKQERQTKPIGARTIRRELQKRRLKTDPSLSTIQRVLREHDLTHSTPNPDRDYRPHPPATYPNAVQATDIVTRWLTGGAVVQTFTTVDHFTNAAYATTHPQKGHPSARAHLLKTWEILGIPDLVQLDNESVFSGGRYAQQFSAIVRLCLYVGCEVLFTPEYEADYNWPVETFNHFWAQQFWDKHHFESRWRIPPALSRFLAWYDTDYVAPRQADTPQHLRRGYQLHHLPARLARQIPEHLPICKGLIHAVRCVAATGAVKFLQQTFRIGKRYVGHYVWLTLDTAEQTLTAYYQRQAEAEWQTLKVWPYPLTEPVQPVLKQFRQLHA